MPPVAQQSSDCDPQCLAGVALTKARALVPQAEGSAHGSARLPRVPARQRPLCAALPVVSAPSSPAFPPLPAPSPLPVPRVPACASVPSSTLVTRHMPGDMGFHGHPEGSDVRDSPRPRCSLSESWPTGRHRSVMQCDKTPTE